MNPALLNPDGSGPVRNVDWDTRFCDYTPMALLVALILATPIHWKCKLTALFWGILLEHLFLIVVFKFFLWCESSEIGIAQITSLARQLELHFQNSYMLRLGLIDPLMIWLLVSFRRSDTSDWINN